MYAYFAEAIRRRDSRLQNFTIAVELHRPPNAIKQASDAGREVKLG